MIDQYDPAPQIGRPLAGHRDPDEPEAADLKAAACRELVALWNDLSDARRNAIGTTWSIQCEQLAARIAQLSTFVGAIPCGAVPLDLVASGIYERLHAEAGIKHDPVDPARIARYVAERRAAAAGRS